VTALGIYELFTCTPEAQKIITADANLEKLREWRRSEGYGTLLQQGIHLAEEGKTSLKEVIRVADSNE